MFYRYCPISLIRRWQAWQLIKTGLTAKSSTQDLVLDSWNSAPLFEQLLLHLAHGFIQLARKRLTSKQRRLLKAASKTLHYRPSLSYTALAETLSQKLSTPLSTVKFNLRVLRDTGLITVLQTRKWHNPVTLSPCGQLLVELLGNTQSELPRPEGPESSQDF